MIRFYTSIICPFAHRVDIALTEALAAKYSEKVERIEIDLKNKPDWYLKINPQGKVPCLISEDETILIESAILAEYVLEKYAPNSTLIASGNLELKAKMKIFSSWFSDSVIPAFYSCLRASNETLEVEKLKYFGSLEKLEAMLTESSPQGPFAFGQEFTLADILSIPWIVRSSVLKELRNVEIPQHLTRVRQWSDACLNRASVKNTSPTLDSLVNVYSAYVPK